MNLTTIHPIAIIVSDYQKSRDFYVNKLGFEVIRENYRKERDDYKLDLKLGSAELEFLELLMRHNDQTIQKLVACVILLSK